jgi:two-component system, OmpR family, KDP operon response regulator KdpE
MSSPAILIVDDESQIRKMLSITLHANDYKVLEASSGKEALTLVASRPPDLILLDLGLPDINGQDLLKHFREWYSNPIIILSVQSDEADIVKALDSGANDYLVKPFRTGELLARIRSALRFSQSDDNIPVAEFNDLRIDFSARIVQKNGQVIKLTATEYNLLAIFAKNEGKVLTHHYLLINVWGPSYTNESQYLRVFVAQLRKKIEQDANRPVHLITESGVGYRFLAK